MSSVLYAISKLWRKGLESSCFFGYRVSNNYLANGFLKHGPLWVSGTRTWYFYDQFKYGDEMVGWHYRLKGHEFKQAPGVGDRQGSLACCSPGGSRVGTRLSDWMNWTNTGSPRDWLGLLSSPVIFLNLMLGFNQPLLLDFSMQWEG